MAAEQDMTFDTLTSIYRVEKNSATLSTVRKDLYPAMRELFDNQAKECDRLAAASPDSIMFDGAVERKKKILLRMKMVMEVRIRKIAEMALRGAMGAVNIVDAMTPEEKEYYNAVLDLSKKHLSITNKRPKAYIPDISSDNPREAPAKVEEPLSVKAPEPTAEPVLTVPDDVADDDTVGTEDLMFPDDGTVPIPEDEPPEKPAKIPAPAEYTGDDDDSEDDAEEDPMPARMDDETVTRPVTAVRNEPESEGPNVIIRVLEDLPVFSGPERDYDLKKEDIVCMPKIMANALISRQKAVQIKTTS